MADAELLVRLRAGDGAAFVALVRAHHASLCRVARAFVRSPAVAEEVVQETWLAVVRGIGRFEGRSSLRTWLLHILVNRARSVAGTEARVEVGFDPDATRFDGEGVWSSPPVPWSETVDERVAAQQLASLVGGILETLPDLQRQVVLLRDVEGLPAGDVAAVLGITDGNQRVLLHRARARIRAELEAKVGGR